MPRHHHLLRRHPAPDTSSPSDSTTPTTHRNNHPRRPNAPIARASATTRNSKPLRPKASPFPRSILPLELSTPIIPSTATPASMQLTTPPQRPPSDQMMDDDEDIDDEEEEEDDAIPEEYDGVGFSHETTLSSIARQRTRHRQRQFQRSISEEDGMLPAHDVDVAGPSDIEEEDEEEEEEVEHDEQVEEDEEDVEIEPEAGSESEMLHEREKSPTPLPANLREISSLASWTVSTHKPGCGVTALRHPSPTQYWQSDGPQPHTLTLHFFKLVAIVRIRVYLDFEMDESYTPTKMTFLAGMGGNDLVEFANWEGEGPCGWVDVQLEGVGGRSGGWVTTSAQRQGGAGSGSGAGGGRKKKKKSGRRRKGKGKRRGGFIFEDPDVDVDEDDEDDDDDDDDEEDDPYAGNVLKAMVIQMRIIENHQNGKDTHVRGFQVFARDDERKRVGNAPSASADGRVRRHSARRSLRASTHEDMERDGVSKVVTSLEEPDWMGEPVIR
ncbi:galactose-binding like protein [Aspergillus eucalypticola CBS 122712]|uniref:Galactose-binding like protein n=1 Tax=Aspergillus eucalypticola (strain CBS 122712 / IBT 29274) TaxID=1448314 RepID=A0A317WCY9_ASPEC|nr:galactose-binding like protein [Aspergillus eucalypticola CBS 122712]PWY84233.1 galactose-binding like protein [Aspergillus eucalypticola CBS 122712]